MEVIEEEPEQMSDVDGAPNAPPPQPLGPFDATVDPSQYTPVPQAFWHIQQQSSHQGTQTSQATLTESILSGIQRGAERFAESGARNLLQSAGREAVQQLARTAAEAVTSTIPTTLANLRVDPTDMLTSYLADLDLPEDYKRNLIKGLAEEFKE